MSVVATIIEKAIEFAYRHFGATQLCWLCIVATCGGGWFFATHYAQASELQQLSDDVVDVRESLMAKSIFDYRVKQCETPKEQRQEKRWIVEALRVEVSKYQKLTGRPFNMPACEDL